MCPVSSPSPAAGNIWQKPYLNDIKRQLGRFHSYLEITQVKAIRKSVVNQILLINSITWWTSGSVWILTVSSHEQRLHLLRSLVSLMSSSSLECCFG